MPLLKDFIGLYGIVFYKNGAFRNPAIKGMFRQITAEDGLSPGDLVWVHEPAVDGREDRCGFKLVMVARSTSPSAGPGKHIYRVPNEPALMLVIEKEPQAYQRVPVQ